MPTSRGLSAGSSDVARFLDTAHKARYVEIFESQVLKTAESSLNTAIIHQLYGAMEDNWCLIDNLAESHPSNIAINTI